MLCRINQLKSRIFRFSAQNKPYECVYFQIYNQVPGVVENVKCSYSLFFSLQEFFLVCEMMTEGFAEKKLHHDNNSKTRQDNIRTKMVSVHQALETTENKKKPESVNAAVPEHLSRSSRPRSRRASMPKRQLSRTDSTMVELTTETIEPIILRRSPELPDVSDVARKKNKDTEGTTTVIYRRRGSGSIKKKLTRTDSTLMVVTTDPKNLALRIEPPSFDEHSDGPPDIFPDTLFEDLEAPYDVFTRDNSSWSERPSGSPPILISEHTEVRNASVNRQHSLIGAIVQNNTKNKRWQVERQQSLPSSSSCPNLRKEAKAFDVGVVKQKLRSTRSSDTSLNEKSGNDEARSKSSLSSSSSKLLKVPDMFITSFQTSLQCSGSSEELQKVDSDTNNHRHSAPELDSLLASLSQTDATEHHSDRSSIVKSLSDNSSSDKKTTLKTLSDSRIKMFQSVDAPEPPPPPFEPIFGQIVEGVFMGNVESTFCERLLCKYNIGSVVDVSGCPPSAVPEHKRSDVPCACQNQARHLRAFLRLCLAEANPRELREMLEKTNKFIEGARNKNRGALISCYYGNHWSVVVVIYYLMTIRGMNLRKAYSLAMIHRSDLELSSENKHFLQQVEKTLFAPCDQSLCFEVANHNIALLPREAWADESAT